MLKKFYIILIITILISSCGKKGDPVYEGQNTKTPKNSIYRL
tara:strand:- start:592 stop:717 length:126 start_codon:yes stop_codon:yes gene_type:complete